MLKCTTFAVEPILRFKVVVFQLFSYSKILLLAFFRNRPLEHGSNSDEIQQGRRVDMSNCVIIMTSNIGSAATANGAEALKQQEAVAMVSSFYHLLNSKKLQTWEQCSLLCTFHTINENNVMVCSLCTSICFKRLSLLPWDTMAFHGIPMCAGTTVVLSRICQSHRCGVAPTLLDCFKVLLLDILMCSSLSYRFTM